jgi:hypothetical protein
MFCLVQDLRYCYMSTGDHATATVTTERQSQNAIQPPLT